MGDQFEKYVIENRALFDDEEPSQEAWNKIDQKLDHKKSGTPIFWKIAAFLFLLSTLVLVIDKNLQNQTGPVLSEEFVEAEDYYITLINRKKVLIKEELTPSQEKAFLTEINELDSMYSELKKTFQTNALNERVVDAMINNLKLRLDILNRQLEILQNIKGQSNATETIIEI